MVKYKIKFKKEKCLGCGACTQCDNWKIGTDGKASPLKWEFRKVGCNSIAKEVCPVNIIKIIKVNE